LIQTNQILLLFDIIKIPKSQQALKWIILEEKTLALKLITTPDLGGATDVTVIEVLVKPGEKIEADAPIVTLESDKATMEVPTTDAGVVKAVKVKVGDKVSTGFTLLELEAGSDSKAASENANQNVAAQSSKEEIAAQSASTVVSRTPAPEQASAIPAKAAPTNQTAHLADVHAGPGVRRFARELGVDLAQVTGSGPRERILKEDVQAFVKRQLSQGQGAGGFALPAAPAIDFSQFGPIETQPLSRIQKISGKNLARNWMTVPHVTQFGEADITALEAFRQAKKDEMEKQQIKLTPLVFIMKAVVAALKAFPQVNASLDPTGEAIILKQYFHLGVAVDTPDGLVVPVIRDVDQKGMIDLAKELAVVSEKARKKQLTPGQMQGGCFSISSLGGIGGTAFTPIVNAPEVAILGVSKAAYQPVYQDGGFVPRLMLPLSFSYDHRVIDGALGARFIVYLSQMLSDIRNLLL
jgi:pyruvate dehydrogenase E2 component (dihydrolipoamide acetyltransferase)